MGRSSRTGQDVTFEAAGDLSLLQFTAVKLTAGPAGGPDARVTGAGAGERAHYILQNKPNAAGIGAVVRGHGFSKMKVDGGAAAIIAGDPIKIAAGGLGVKSTTDKDHIIGWACAPSNQTGDIIEIDIERMDLAV